MITAISGNNTYFCGKRPIVTVLDSTEQKKLAEYKQQFDYSQNKPISASLKHAIDVTSSVVGLIVTAPVIIISSIAIKLESDGPILFKQNRVGKDGQIFTIYKLRTMAMNSGEKLLQNPDDQRVTKVGKFLRKYSIDEFPQFINIIKGDMSLVGPRPIIENVHNVRKNDKDFCLRYMVKPGATLIYPNKVEIDNKPNLRIDTEKDYIEHWSLANDIKTFLKIASKIFTGENY